MSYHYRKYVGSTVGPGSARAATLHHEGIRMMSEFTRKWAPTTLACALALPASLAQSQPQPEAAATSMQVVTVSASALALERDDMSTPVTVLDGNDLVLRRAGTLGETLSGLPGIAASHFGAGASRPIIRGMDGPRIKILSDGAEVQDASAISPDHAVGVEPLLVQQIEVLRGPSALAHGGGAVGGVVNVLDKKVPTRMPENGFEGSLEVRGSSGANEKAGAFEVTGGSGNIAIHAEGARRTAEDYRVGSGSGWAEGRKVDGSYSNASSGSVGLSWIGSEGYLGVAYTRERSEYGLPGHVEEFAACQPQGDRLNCGAGADEEGDAHAQEEAHGIPYVNLDSERWDLRGQLRNPVPGFTKLRVRVAFTDYQHQEIEDGVVGTTFKSRAHDGRIEMEHAPIGGVRGVIGLQNTRRDFRALGDEAYVRPTVTEKHALFIVEKYTAGDWRFDGALRHEWQDIAVDSATQQGRSHKGTSASVGAVWKFQSGYSLATTLSRTHRLPSAEELYANGTHIATSTFERGNPDLQRETSRNVDLTLRKLRGATTFSASAYHNRISDYIYGNTLDNFEGFQLIDYAQRDATFTGIEGEIRQKLNSIWDATLYGDMVRAKLDSPDGNHNLPRIPAQRFGVRIDANWQAWSSRLEMYRVDGQDRVAAFEGATPGYNMLNLSANYNTRFGGTPVMLYAKASNLGNVLAFSHSSFIKSAAPLMGRSIALGMRVTF
ncbi:MAG: iron complex outermembrane receptor protein [Janthinobacterium sp.]|jgi:iron complex outermembrane receptor protein